VETALALAAADVTEGVVKGTVVAFGRITAHGADQLVHDPDRLFVRGRAAVERGNRLAAQLRSSALASRLGCTCA
jgi:hypothetical protein